MQDMQELPIGDGDGGPEKERERGCMQVPSQPENIG